MTTRTTTRTVTFTRPFALKGMDAERPAGDYVVETDEELLESLSFVAYRRTATWIRLPRVAGLNAEFIRIDPKEMDDVLQTMGGAAPSE